MFHDIMIAFICIGAYAILILYGIRLTENRNMLPDPIPCRGNVGMWQLPEDVSDSIDEQLAGGYLA